MPTANEICKKAYVLINYYLKSAKNKIIGVLKLDRSADEDQ